MTVYELLTRSWDMLIGRSTGPMKFRLIMQPIVAAFLAVRSGIKDARERRPPYFWSLIANSSQRAERVRHGWKDVGRVFLFAIALDVTYELVVFHWVYLRQAVIVAFLLAIVPYVLIRGLVTLIGTRLVKKEEDHDMLQS